MVYTRQFCQSFKVGRWKLYYLSDRSKDYFLGTFPEVVSVFGVIRVYSTGKVVGGTVLTMAVRRPGRAVWPRQKHCTSLGFSFLFYIRLNLQILPAMVAQDLGTNMWRVERIRVYENRERGGRCSETRRLLGAPKVLL